tara:strand:+ start:753 stop:1520 length:768 start_codon:yes stop_codon:yes gene_type:complete
MTKLSLEGKVALVTGASGGIGSVLTRHLAGAGAVVVATYVDGANALQALSDEVCAAGGLCHAAQLDQRSPESISALVGVIRQRHGRLDILVNNAAWNVGVPFRDLDALSVDAWDRILETNLRGPFLLAQACAALLKANGGGHIVNISSIGGITPIGSSIAYACSKAGLNHLTRCLAVALAPEVAVNCIASGLVESTRMADRAMGADAQKSAREATLLGTGASPEDIADHLLTFLNSRSVTGQILAIDGGVPAAMH